MYWPIISLLQSTSTAGTRCATISSIVVNAMQRNDEIAIAHIHTHATHSTRSTLFAMENKSRSTNSRLFLSDREWINFV